MTDEEHEQIIAKAFPVDYESWRSKRPVDMTPEELAAATNDAQNAIWSAERWLNTEGIDYEDRKYAYESLLRQRKRLADLKSVNDPGRFDVV